MDGESMPTVLSAWEGVPKEELAGTCNVPQLLLLERVGSTNDVARGLASGGAPAGTLVLAEQQLAGRGRAGRAWISPPGLGLWMSLIIRPDALDAPGALPLLVGLTVAEALDPFASPAAIRIKWPNDLWLGDRKLGGILCEAVWEQSRLVFVVVGVGLNVLHAPEDFPEELRRSAASLRMVAAHRPDRRQVATAVIRSLIGMAASPLSLTPQRLSGLEERDVLRGREVIVSEPVSGDTLATGTALGISPEGALVLRTPAGVLRALHSGTVRLAP